MNFISLKHKKTALGFSLVELMVVLFVVGILAAISVPNLIRSRQLANQASAIGTLRAYHSAQMVLGNGKYFVNDFQVLKNQTGDAIDEVLGKSPNNVLKSGYVFTIGAGTFPNTNPTLQVPQTIKGVVVYPAYYIQASPIIFGTSASTGQNGYYIDYSGVIRVAVNQPTATMNSAPLGN